MSAVMSPSKAALIKTQFYDLYSGLAEIFDSDLSQNNIWNACGTLGIIKLVCIAGVTIYLIPYIWNFQYNVQI